MYRYSKISQTSARDENVIVTVNDLEWEQHDHFNEHGEMYLRRFDVVDAKAFQFIVRDKEQRRSAYWTQLNVRAISVANRAVSENVNDPKDDLRAAGMTDMQIAAFEAKHDIDLSPKVETVYESEMMYQVSYQHGRETYPDARWSSWREHKTLMTLDEAMEFCNKFMKRYSAGTKKAA